MKTRQAVLVEPRRFEIQPTDVAPGEGEILVNNGVFKTDRLISHRFALEDVQKAFETLDSRWKGCLKGIVTR